MENPLKQWPTTPDSKPARSLPAGNTSVDNMFHCRREASSPQPIAIEPSQTLVHSPNDRFNTSEFGSPYRNTLPLSRLWNTISAGLKSIGSIL